VRFQGGKLSASDYIKEVRSKVGTIPLLIPGVAGVILNENRELLLQEKSDDKWSLPAGRIEPQESPVQALIREVSEETGLTVKVQRLLGVFGCEGLILHTQMVIKLNTQSSCSNVYRQLLSICNR
tara:strand:- start:179 stop:553 length:375 start_codon:yes stop_codon:yes gene_type:complete